ncbi:unnamed protein product [Caenorhabditis brenneri]
MGCVKTTKIHSTTHASFLKSDEDRKEINICKDRVCELRQTTKRREIDGIEGSRERSQQTLGSTGTDTDVVQE